MPRSASLPSSKDEAPPQVLDSLQKRNAFDMQLYASAKASFERALAKLRQEAAPETMFVHVHGADTGGDQPQCLCKVKRADQQPHDHRALHFRCLGRVA